MNKALQWTIGISVILIVASIIFSTVYPFFVPNTGWGYGYGMMGPGHMWGGGMMGGFGFMGITMLLWPLLFIGLIVLGVVWLVRAVGQPGASVLPTVTCAHCGKPIQAGWKACPHCGEKI